MAAGQCADLVIAAHACAKGNLVVTYGRQTPFQTRRPSSRRPRLPPLPSVLRDIFRVLRRHSPFRCLFMIYNTMSY